MHVATPNKAYDTAIQAPEPPGACLIQRRQHWLQHSFDESHIFDTLIGTKTRQSGRGQTGYYLNKIS